MEQFLREKLKRNLSMGNSQNYFNINSVLFREGDIASNVFIVKSGEVLCLKSSKDRLIPVYLAKPNDILGESAILEGAPFTYSAIALSQVEVISINSTDFHKVMQTAPQWLKDLTLTMGARFQSTAGFVADNRVIHKSILSEEQYTPPLENEYKKLLNQ